MSDLVLTRLASTLGDWRPAGDDEVRFSCPFCPGKGYGEDSHGHLYYNTEKQVFVCFRCGEKGSAKWLCRKAGAHYPEPGALRQVPASLLDLVRRSLSPAQKEDHLGPVTYPCEVRLVVPGSPALPYLISRGISVEEVRAARLSWGTYKGSDRIFFPTFSSDDERMTYWSARAFRNEEPGRPVEKYVNPESRKGSIVYNLDRARRHRQVVITEGVVSALAVGSHGVATFGKAVSLEQRSALLRYPFEEYVVALDGDARREALELASFFLAQGRRASLVCFGKREDPASCDLPRRLEERVVCDFIGLANLKMGIEFPVVHS